MNWYTNELEMINDPDFRAVNEMREKYENRATKLLKLRNEIIAAKNILQEKIDWCNDMMNMEEAKIPHNPIKLQRDTFQFVLNVLNEINLND